jgi:erythromycin esterase-like protein
MFESAHDPGCDDWYDDLEAWMRARGERVTAETVALAALKIGGAMGIWVPEDLRFLKEIDTQKAAMAREEVRKAS